VESEDHELCIDLEKPAELHCRLSYQIPRDHCFQFKAPIVSITFLQFYVFCNAQNQAAQDRIRPKFNQQDSRRDAPILRGLSCTCFLYTSLQKIEAPIPAVSGDQNNG